MANFSYRLGNEAAPQTVRKATRVNEQMAAAYDRYREHLAANGVEIDGTRTQLGPWLTIDPDSERFVGESADRANTIAMRDYREPFVVPEVS